MRVPLVAAVLLLGAWLLRREPVPTSPPRPPAEREPREPVAESPAIEEPARRVEPLDMRGALRLGLYGMPEAARTLEVRDEPYAWWALELMRHRGAYAGPDRTRALERAFLEGNDEALELLASARRTDLTSVLTSLLPSPRAAEFLERVRDEPDRSDE